MLDAIIALTTSSQIAPVKAGVGFRPPDCVIVASMDCSTSASPTQLFVLAERYAAIGDLDRAIVVLKALESDRNSDYRAEARARLARLYVQKGELYKAADWYRRLLDEKPDAAAVRIELAALLSKIGDERASLRQLRLAEGSNLPEAVARLVRQQRDAAISRAPISFFFSAGIAPDSNINTATTANTVDIAGLPFSIDRNGQARSGIGATYAIGTILRTSLSSDSRWITQIGSNGSLYRKSRYNDISVSLDTGPQWTRGKIDVRPSLQLGRRFFFSDTLYNYYGFASSVSYYLDSRSLISIGSSVNQFNYSRLYNRQSGPVAVLRVGYDRAMSPRLFAHVGITQSRSNSREPSLALSGSGFDASLRRDIKGISLTIQGSASQSHAEAVYLPFNIKRDDTFLQAGAFVLVRSWSFRGFSPQLGINYTKNISPISIFEYQRLRGDFSLTKTF